MVSVGRTDWSIWRPILDAIREHPDLDLRLYLTGMHLSPEFGMTVNQVLDEGFEVEERLEVLLSSDSPQGVAKAIGLGVLDFAQVFSRSKPDILLVLGDRFETLAAVTAAMPFKIPVAHIHGGESTEGAIDESIRHAITKMSHIHFTATQFYADRILRMGEEARRVFVTGAPGIDTIRLNAPFSDGNFCHEFGIDISRPFLLVTYHPVTLEFEDTAFQIENLLCALDRIDTQVIFTYPNADTAGRSVLAMIKDFAASHCHSKLVVNMGSSGYISAMHHAAAMVGNSSSGIIEAAAFELPVVNVGTRQGGRTRARNVIDVGYPANEIFAGIEMALSDEFRDSLRNMQNPYGDGSASQKIVDVLRKIELGQTLIVKKFNDV